MCGRYTHRLTWEEVHDLLRLTSPARAPDDWKTSFNVAPTDVMPVVRLDREGRRELAMLRWGLIPYKHVPGCVQVCMFLGVLTA